MDTTPELILDQARRTWHTEPKVRSERRWTPDGAGWHAWNGKSPEREFVEFVGALVAMARPGHVIETGVGQGFTTRRILRHLPKASRVTLYESDADFRAVLAGAVTDRRATVAEEVTPAAFDDVGVAVLDSRTGLRIAELARWAATAPAGSFVIVHDVSPSHPEGSIHRRLAAVIAELETDERISGLLLPNPRGSWLARLA